MRILRLLLSSALKTDGTEGATPEIFPISPSPVLPTADPLASWRGSEGHISCMLKLFPLPSRQLSCLVHSSGSTAQVAHFVLWKNSCWVCQRTPQGFFRVLDSMSPARYISSEQQWHCLVLMAHPKKAQQARQCRSLGCPCCNTYIYSLHKIFFRISGSKCAFSYPAMPLFPTLWSTLYPIFQFAIYLPKVNVANKIHLIIKLLIASWNNRDSRKIM